MSNVIKGLMAFGLLAAVAACQQAPEDEYVVVEPVTAEPVSSGKY
ncbi:hypothetical protein [Roseovarius sp. M141]|nr:hypothetical protein [Roseovarius sp. M141]